MGAAAAAPSSGPIRPVIDPELQALPEPRRPWRRATLATMAVTAIAALGVATTLLPLASYGLRTGAPREIGALTHVQLGAGLANRWVHAVGTLGPRSVEYRRPLDADRYRLTPSEGDPRIWVEVRVPEDVEPEHYVTPNSFVGRLVPVRDAGLRHAAVPGAVEAALGHPLPADTWILVDGEAPATTRWAIGFVALFVAFAAFNVWGVARLLRPVRPTRAG